MLLGSATLSLKKEDHEYTTTDERLLTVFVAASGGEGMRLPKIESVSFDPELLEAGLVVLKRESAVTIVAIDDIFAIEQDRTAEQKEKRRTGFA